MRRTTAGPSKLLIAVLATIGLLVRLLAPMPALASPQSGIASELASLGIALCHTDSGSTTPDPIDTGPCDHCPLCTVAGTASLLPAAVALVLAAPSLTEVRLPAVVNTAARPRAPPERANPPRAPPTV